MPNSWADDEDESLQSLVANSRSRVLSYRILEGKGCDLTRLECAHLGLELAIKALLAAQSQSYAPTHDLSGQIRGVLGYYEKNKTPDLEAIARRLNSYLLRPLPERKFWTTKSRYALIEVDAERLEYANNAVEISEEILESISEDV